MRQEKTCYCYDKDGYFIGTSSDYGGDLPNNATYMAPAQSCLLEEKIPRWDGKKWNAVESHIGREGYVDGKYTSIEHHGPLPIGWCDTLPEPILTVDQKRAVAYATPDSDDISVDSLQRQIQQYDVEIAAREIMKDKAGMLEYREKRENALIEVLKRKNQIRKEIQNA